MEQEAILAYMRSHEGEARRRARMYAYYRGQHDILNRIIDDPSKPNNRLCNGFPVMIANAYTGYIFGEPVSYTAEDAVMSNLNDVLKYNDEQAENTQLGMDLSICGVAVEIHYIDRDAHLRFKRVDPVNCVEVRGDDEEESLTALIRYYDRMDPLTKKVIRKIEVYEPEVVTYYEQEGGTLAEIKRVVHYYGDVPAVVYQNNIDRLGDFERVITLIDAYDMMQSESLNDQEYFSDAYLMLKGIGELPDGGIAEMKKNRILMLADDGDAQWLIKQQNDAFSESIKNRLNTDIHRFSGCPDMTDEHFAGNSSGVALKYKLLQFENVAGTKEREFKRGLQRRLELLCAMWRTKSMGNADWRDIHIEFKRALPENLLELSQTLSNLGDLISDETKRGLLPMDIDEETEKERLKAQREEGMSLYSFASGADETQLSVTEEIQ